MSLVEAKKNQNLKDKIRQLYWHPPTNQLICGRLMQSDGINWRMYKDIPISLKYGM